MIHLDGARAWSPRSVGSRYSGRLRENFGIETKVCVDNRFGRKRRSVCTRAIRCVRAPAPLSPFNTRPAISKYGVRAFMERWNKSGFARDDHWPNGAARNSPTGQGSSLLSRRIKFAELTIENRFASFVGTRIAIVQRINTDREEFAVPDFNSFLFFTEKV